MSGGSASDARIAAMLTDDEINALRWSEEEAA